jgi:hypothetical protein
MFPLEPKFENCPYELSGRQYKYETDDYRLLEQVV